MIILIYHFFNNNLSILNLYIKDESQINLLPLNQKITGFY